MGLAQHVPLVRRVPVRLHTTMRRRSASGGFTLLELMVVVVLIALIAMIAIPSLSRQRTDKMTFNYAREVTQIYMKARSNAVGTGAAHLVVFTKQFNNGEGAVVSFESRDNTCLPGQVAPCPSNPSNSCRNAVQYAQTWTIGNAPNPALGRVSPDVGVVNMGTNSAADLRRAEGMTMTGSFNGAVSPAIAMCITPLGETFVAIGGNIATSTAAINEFTLPLGDIPAANDPTMSGTARIEILVRRATGLGRRVIITGSTAGRIRSE